MPFALLSHEIREKTGKEPLVMVYEKLLSPNAVLSKRAMQVLVAGQIALFLLGWQSLTPAVIPKPTEVLGSLWGLITSGLLGDLYVSLALYAEAVLLATIFSLALSYAAALAFFSPIAAGWAKLRFLGIVGLPFLFTLYLSGAHDLKLALLTFFMSTFMVTGMLDVIACIPKEKYDLARTLRMNEWQVVWEVVVLGRADFMLDVVRQNSAIGFASLSMIEGLFRSEGGIGAVLVTQSKHFNLAEIAAIQIVVLICGVSQDYLIGVVKRIVCPYASLLLERR